MEFGIYMTNTTGSKHHNLHFTLVLRDLYTLLWGSRIPLKVVRLGQEGEVLIWVDLS